MTDPNKASVTKAALMAIAENLIDFVIKKNTDYGDSWQSYGIFIPAIRMKDKLVRVETLIDGRQALVADETFGDTIKDIVAYGWLAMLRMEWEAKHAAKPAGEYTQPYLFNLDDVVNSIDEPSGD